MVKTVLIVGLGSIGQRYARLLREIYGNKINIIALRTRGLKFSINEDFTINKDMSPEKKYNIISFSRINELVKNSKISHAIICSPPNKHISDVIKILKFCKPKILIEKPISHKSSEIKKIVDKYKSHSKNIYISQQLRYSPLISKIKKLLNNRVFGKISYASFIFSEYLPLMHPYEDYLKSHASIKRKGGGVVLNLNHDIDIMFYLFGMPSAVVGMENKNNILNIDCEESVNLIYKYKKRNNDFNCRVDLDFIGKPTKREWKIIGEKGSITIDLISSTYHLLTHNKGKILVNDKNKIRFG